MARLLEAMIDAAPNLTLLELEGPVAFLYAWTRDNQEPSTVRVVVNQMVAMHRAFHACRQHTEALNICRCEGCLQAGRLRIKFVAQPRRRRRPVGEAVLEARRSGRDRRAPECSKTRCRSPNTSSCPKPYFERLNEGVRSRGQALTQELEGWASCQPTSWISPRSLATPSRART